MLSIKELQAKTDAAKERIHREKYASQEEMDEFFAGMAAGPLPDRIKSEIENAANAGKSEVDVRLLLPRRILWGLSLNVSKSDWVSYKKYYPSQAKRIAAFFAGITEAHIHRLDSRGYSLDSAEEPCLWVKLEWYTERPRSCFE